MLIFYEMPYISPLLLNKAQMQLFVNQDLYPKDSFSFHLTGNGKGLDIVGDKSHRFIQLFSSQTYSTVDFEVAHDYVCALYGQSKAGDVNKAQNNKLANVW